MQFVRCGACGAKALPAASRCPRCGEALNLRDDRGTLVPLARCASCDTYFPKVQGRCKWCSDGGDRRSSRPWIPIAIGLALVAVGLAAWYWRTCCAAPAPIERSAPVAPRVTIDPGAALTVDSTSVAPPAQRTDSVVPAARVEERPLPPVGEPLPAGVAWVRATARTWVNVHERPGRSTATIGVVERGGQVQLGDVAEGWRRVRLGALMGWVDASLFALDSTGGRR